MLSNTEKIMNKDALFATIIGLAIGVVLTGIILLGPNLAKSFPKGIGIALPKKTTAPTPTPSTKEAPYTISIDSPLPEAIESEENLLVSGSATKGSTVIIQGSVNDTVVLTNSDGKYAGKITLSEGKNDISVTGYNGKERATQAVRVYYTLEEW